MLLYKSRQTPYRCDLAISANEQELMELRDRIVQVMFREPDTPID